MKTVRILLYPDDEQQRIMEICTMTYGAFLLREVIRNNWDILPAEAPEALCGSSAVQLIRDIHRRMRKSSTMIRSIPHPYCRWGNDYRLTDHQVILPLGKGWGTDELTISCVVRPFQIRLLKSKHPETLVLKHMKKHWFAYLLVEGDK